MTEQDDIVEKHKWCVENLTFYPKWDYGFKLSKVGEGGAAYDIGVYSRDYKRNLEIFIKSHKEKRDKAERKIGRLRRKLEREVKELEEFIAHEDKVLEAPVKEYEEMEQYYDTIIAYHRNYENEGVNLKYHPDRRVE